MNPGGASMLRFLLSVLVLLALARSSVVAADWPMYRHDARRSAATDEELALPLKLAWSYTCAQPPAPAWPDTFPQRLLNRMDFDYAPQLAIAEGIVCFGSSADDTVRALDAKTGEEKWHFITGGPVRFSPQIEKGRVYFGSDDGYVYCLNAATGKLVWRFLPAPADERFIGNHRMISRWPIRTGVLVADGVAYAVAGMWPAEGVFIYALAADTGKVLWCNDTVGGTPQGALLLGGDVLLIPNGNSKTTPLDRRTGKLKQWPTSNAPPGWVAGTYLNKRYMGGGPGRGGTWVTVDADKEYSFVIHRANQLDIEPYSLTNGLAERGWIVNPQPLFVGWAYERGKVSAIIHKGRTYTRKAYGMALSGDTLLLGHDGAVAAQRGTNELWRTAVAGEARELAVAEGRLFVATSKGVITCFAPGGGKAEGRDQRSVASGQNPDKSKIANPKSEIIERLRSVGMDRGFALVLGDGDGQMSLALAAQTQLQVINALTDAAAANVLRERLLTKTTFYGSRIHVQTVSRLDRLPFAQYFANAVIVAGGTSGISGKELYRVLRPAGGILLLAGLKGAQAEALVKETGASEKEIRRSGDDACVVRGKLSGALDWDNTMATQMGIGTDPRARSSDQRVKWPLRLLWFGGPATRQVQNDVEGAHRPTPANGRYFEFGERTLTAVDAYNGAVLWSRPIPEAYPGVREVDGVLYRVSDAVSGRPDRSRGCLVNNESVFLVLGAEYFQGKGEGTIQLDAQTGEQKKIYGKFNPPAPVVSLKSAQTWYLTVDTNVASSVDAASSRVGAKRQDAASTQSGTVTMESASRGLVLTLTTRDPSVTPLDAWELFFDFRPVEARYGLYERGAFHIRVEPARDEKTPAAWRLITGPEAPKLDVTGTRDTNGTKTTVSLPWTELEQWVGIKPSSFDFAATLNAHDGLPAVASSVVERAKAGGRDEPIVRRHLFGNWAADGINNGWARIVLDDSKSVAASTNPPAIMSAGPLGGSYGPAGYGQTVVPSALDAPGIHPLTGEPVPKIYGIAPVCGGAYCAATIISQAGGLYDLTDNSGRRPCFPGVKTGCTTPQVAALGLFIISEEWGHCVCNYPFRGSLALAPAERRLNEDWASFYDRDVDTRVRQAFVNFGAPGDRQDEKGNLWLGFPRNSELRRQEDYPSMHHPLPYPLGMRDAQVGLWPRRPIRSILWLPLDVDIMASFGPYRFNADRARIQGMDRPWIYGSGYRGIQKATLKLDFFKPLVSLPALATITVDGKLDEASWGNEFQSTTGAERATSAAPALPYTGTRVAFRHDSQNLYVGLQRPPMTVVKRTPTSGADAAFNYEPTPWRVTTNSAADNISSGDNWWRLIVSDASARKAVYLTVTPNGTRADALHDPADGGTGSTTNALNRAWNPEWQSAVQTNDQGWAMEMAIPWATLAEAGLNKDQLAVNFLMFDPGIGTEALTYLGIGGYDRCSNFTPLGLGKPAAVPARAFTIRLHFAEPDANARPGERVFDVKLQGKTVLNSFDIVKEAGSPLTALVKEFQNVTAADALTLEFVPAVKDPTPQHAPILCGLELAEETRDVSPPSH